MKDTREPTVEEICAEEDRLAAVGAADVQRLREQYGMGRGLLDYRFVGGHPGEPVAMRMYGMVAQHDRRDD